MKAIDPVCNMDVDTETTEHTFEYNGETYYFCCPGCKATFEREPEKYISGESDHSGHHHH